MKELINRWKVGDYIEFKENVINSIKKGRSLNSIVGLPKIGGRYDLRGIKFVDNPEVTKIRNYEKPSKPFFFENYDLSQADLSFADFQGTVFINCKIANSIFTKSNFKGVHVDASHFSDTRFSDCDFTDSYLNMGKGDDSGSFSNVVFESCNFSRTIFHFPQIKNCLFKDCKLWETNFDASQFYDTKFIGTLDSCFFNGYLTPPNDWLSKIIRSRSLEKIYNPMSNVDFSMAKLRGVSFSNGINLSNCIFPDDGNHLFVENLEETYSEAKKIISDSWVGEDKRVGIGLIDKVYFAPKNQRQSNGLIDMSILSSNGKDMEFGQKFYNLIEEILKSRTQVSK